MRRRLLAAALLVFPGVTFAQGSAGSAASAIDFSGQILGNFQVRTDSASKAPLGGKSPNKFEIERVYLTFRMPAGEHASIRVTTDVFQNTAGSYYNGWSIRLKYAYLQYNFSNALAGVKDLALLGRIGIVNNVVIDHAELFWPRWISQTPVERAGFFNSADLGMAAQLTLPGRVGEIYATVTNGPGYAAAETDRFKDFAARFTWTPLARDSGFLRTLTLSPWFYKGATASTAPATYTDALRRDRYGLIAGVHDRRLTAAAEWARRVETVETIGPPRITADRTGQLLSAYTVARPVEWFRRGRSPFSIIARLDHFQPNVDADPINQLLIAGVAWDVTPRVSFAMDYQAQTFAHYATPLAEQRVLFLHWQTVF